MYGDQKERGALSGLCLVENCSTALCRPYVPKTVSYGAPLAYISDSLHALSLCGLSVAPPPWWGTVSLARLASSQIAHAGRYARVATFPWRAGDGDAPLKAPMEISREDVSTL
jgi:hypothetical protein